MPSEFSIIEKYFSFSVPAEDCVGVGDDAAVLAMPGCAVAHAGRLVAACDTLQAGRHFPDGASGRDVAARAVACNLSDFAAMGAQPRWLLLSMSLPQSDEAWLADFSGELRAACERHQLALVGGDTTRGPLAITLTVLGSTPVGSSGQGDSCLLRSGANAGDDLWLSGELGGSAAWLEHFIQGAAQSGSEDDGAQFLRTLDDASLTSLRSAYYHPEPRLDLGMALHAVASAAIDVSDGLLADAGHIAAASGVVLEIEGPSLPLHPVLAEHAHCDFVQRWVLAGGDDYELLFSAPPSKRKEVEGLARQLDLRLSRIGAFGSAVASTRYEVSLTGRGWARPEQDGYQHF